MKRSYLAKVHPSSDSPTPIWRGGLRVEISSSDDAARRDSAPTLLDKPAPLRVDHGFEAVMCSQLAVDVVQVVAKRLGGNAQRARNGRGIAPFSEKRKDASLLVGERRNRRVTGHVFGERNELSGALNHSVE
jgi:hypothetical protein